MLDTNSVSVTVTTRLQKVVMGQWAKNGRLRASDMVLEKEAGLEFGYPSAVRKLSTEREGLHKHLSHAEPCSRPCNLRARREVPRCIVGS